MRITISLFFTLLFFFSYGQKWKYIDDSVNNDLQQLNREVIPSQYATLKLDLSDLNSQLLNAPAENQRSGY